MTLTQRADKIVNASWCDRDGYTDADFRNFVISEIREAVEEATELNRREIEVAHKIVEGVKALNDKQLEIAREAKAEAYAECAKIARDCPTPHDCEGPMIARQIEARAKETK